MNIEERVSALELVEADRRKSREEWFMEELNRRNRALYAARLGAEETTDPQPSERVEASLRRDDEARDATSPASPSEPGAPTEASVFAAMLDAIDCAHICGTSKARATADAAIALYAPVLARLATERDHFKADRDAWEKTAKYINKGRDACAKGQTAAQQALAEHKLQAKRAAEDARESLAAWEAERKQYERNIHTCLWCNLRYSDRFDDAELAAHLKVCPSHPMRAVEKERDQARAPSRDAWKALGALARLSAPPAAEGKETARG